MVICMPAIQLANLINERPYRKARKMKSRVPRHLVKHITIIIIIIIIIVAIIIIIIIIITIIIRWLCC